MSINRNEYIFYHKGYVTRHERNLRYGHRSGLILFTGLPASGKSTIAHGLEKRLFEEGLKVYILDGDNIRHGLNADLGFSINDRRENLRRVAEVSKLLVDAGLIVLASFVAPFERDRDYIKSKFKEDDFIEVYVSCPVEICEKRDHKGLYKKAHLGIINNYTGVNAPYEEPKKPHVLIQTDLLPISNCVQIVYRYLFDSGWLCTPSL